MEGIVEQVRDGSSLRVYLLPEFQFVQVFVAGIQVRISQSLFTTNSISHHSSQFALISLLDS